MASQDNALRQPLFGYPFDQWAGSIILAATDRLDAEAIGLENGMVVQLSDVVLGDSTCE
jgi:hypothetical protein